MFAHESTGLITLSVIILACVSALGMLRSTCCAAAASLNLHGTQRYLLKTT